MTYYEILLLHFLEGRGCCNDSKEETMAGMVECYGKLDWMHYACELLQF